MCCFCFGAILGCFDCFSLIVSSFVELEGNSIGNGERFQYGTHVRDEEEEREETVPEGELPSDLGLLYRICCS